MVESDSVSVYDDVDKTPIGGVHTSEIAVVDPFTRLEIGSPDEIENHDPVGKLPDCKTVSTPGPRFETEIELLL
mgnify:FL=1